MAFFATYCGLIYNDFLSISIPYSKSCYKIKRNDIVRENECVFPFGFDYVWNTSENKITYVNSFKMKISVIIGVIHMIIGIILKGLNAIHFGQLLSFFFEFLP